ncbi:unnamed protein product [Mytilus coruscus]|uniref:B box-type domain-containing protein n=1 Tax=Mytilus coruscus TaxID=42192 RepID=A0A6J7ZZY6_MYTCO|nr:unnamed protein product [Mytilus coruscus]
MASSTSEKICTPIHCQICDISSDLKWMCSECDLYFCVNCDLKFHGKNKILTGHTKINIEHCSTENITELIRKAEVENITCSLHKEQKCDIFCRDCHNPICKICVSTDSHRNHELTSIEDMLNEKITERKDFQNRIESYINHYTQTVNELEFMLEKAKEKYNRTKENILNTEKESVTETKDYVTSLEKRMESELNYFEKNVKEEIKVVDSVKSKLLKEEELSQALTPLKMLTKKYNKNLFYQVNDYVYRQRLKQTCFITVQFDRRNIFGSAIEKKLRGNLLKGPDFKHITSFETKLKGISKLLPVGNCKVMIASYKEEILQKISFEKSEIKDEQELLETKLGDMDIFPNTICDKQFKKSEIKDEQKFLETEDAIMDIKPNLFSDNEFEGFEIFVEQELSKTKVFDMDIMPNGNILLSIQECELKLLKGKEIIDHASFHSFSPLKTFGIHVNKNNEIIVGISAGFPSEDQKTKRGKIVVLNLEGIVKKIHDSAKDKYWNENEWFGCPTRIVTNQDNTICFIDIFEKSYYRDKGQYHDITSLEMKGRVVGIDQEGELKWTYNGTKHQQFASYIFFCPQDIAIIHSTGCILIHEFVDDYRRPAFHIISQNGNAIGYSELYKTELSYEIKDLRSVAIDKDGKLYLGEDREQYRYNKAKIHVLEFI